MRVLLFIEHSRLFITSLESLILLMQLSVTGRYKSKNIRFFVKPLRALFNNPLVFQTVFLTVFQAVFLIFFLTDNFTFNKYTSQTVLFYLLQAFS